MVWLRAGGVTTFREDLCTAEEWLGQDHCLRVVVADGVEHDDWEAACFGLEADVGAVKVKAEGGSQSQGRIPGLRTSNNSSSVETFGRDSTAVEEPLSVRKPDRRD